MRTDAEHIEDLEALERTLSSEIRKLDLLAQGTELDFSTSKGPKAVDLARLAEALSTVREKLRASRATIAQEGFDVSRLTLQECETLADLMKKAAGVSEQPSGA